MAAPKNAFKAALRDGRFQLGLWAALGSAYAAEILSTSGYDWLLIDGEHGPNDMPLISAQIGALRHAPTHAMVRPPMGEAWVLKQLLDQGAQTFLIPMVESAEQATALVERVRASVARAAASALDDLAASLPGPIESFSLRALPANFPQDISTQRRSPYEARADAVMYRTVLVELAEQRGWRVHYYLAKDVEQRAAELLGDRATEVLHGPRQALGPPWTKDHRMALAATVLAVHKVSDTL